MGEAKPKYKKIRIARVGYEVFDKDGRNNIEEEIRRLLKIKLLRLFGRKLHGLI